MTSKRLPLLVYLWLQEPRVSGKALPIKGSLPTMFVGLGATRKALWRRVEGLGGSRYREGCKYCTVVAGFRCL